MELHPDKTRLIEFGRLAAQSRRARGEGKPQTFNFLGFTHSCGKTREGWFAVLRTTMRKKWQAKLREIAEELRRRMHAPVPDQGTYLGSVVRGHIQYYGVPRNGRALSAFRLEVAKLWRKMLQRRSHKHRLTRKRMQRLVARWLPPVRICHPYPSQRFGVRT